MYTRASHTYTRGHYIHIKETTYDIYGGKPYTRRTAEIIHGEYRGNHTRGGSVYHQDG